MKKIKIGTQMDERIFRSLKVTAARENKPIGILLEEAVAEYITRHRPRPGKSGLRRFLDSPRAQISDESFRQILQADYYEQ
jgi:hypothetical protein